MNGLPRNNVARLNSDGSADHSFNAGTEVNGTVNTLARHNTGPHAGKFVIAGSDQESVKN